MGSGGSRLISFHPSPAKESAGSRGGFLGDLEYAILSHYVGSGFAVDSLSSIARSVGVDVRRVYDAVKRLVSRGFLERVRRGTYRLTEAGGKALVKLGVRRLSGRVRQGKPDGTGGATALPAALPSSRALPGGRPAYGGAFYDNVRYYVGGVYQRTGRDEVMSPRDLSVADSVSYLEVGYWVRNLVVGGVVVVYSNLGDGYATRVEWRPPRGYVKENGVASTLRLAKRELASAFRAVAIVLGEVLSPRELSGLYGWLSQLWAPAVR